MAEPATQNESIALYQYLCQKIVGTEEHVKTIRMRNAVSDHLSSYDYMEMITSGSLGEGLEMRGSDIDKMRVMTFIEVCENTNVPINTDKTYFTMETVDAQSGFTQLRLIHINKRLNMLELCEEIGGEYYFSNMTFKQRYSNKFCPIIHGPCLSDREGIFDYANCLHCRSWITQAHQWITRANNSWPGCDVKQSIINHGVLFVPKGVQGSTKEDLEWRISFSVGEKLLIYTFTHTQLLCYALMKILLRDVISIDLDCKELLCSYFMKTILFWISEEFPVSIWSPKNLISNFIMYLQRLIYCVEYSICPHYFIPENNLFENKIAGCKKETLMRKLNYLTSYGWKYLLFSDQFNELAFHIHKDASLFYDNILKQILSPIRYLTDISIYISLSSLRKQFHKMLSFQSSNIQYLYSLYISTICSHTVQFIPLNVLDDNKFTLNSTKSV